MIKPITFNESQVMKGTSDQADTGHQVLPQASYEDRSIMKHPEMQLASRRLSAKAYLQVASVVGMITHGCLAHADAVLDQVSLVAIQLIVKGLMLLFSLQLLLGQACTAANTMQDIKRIHAFSTCSSGMTHQQQLSHCQLISASAK